MVSGGLLEMTFLVVFILSVLTIIFISYPFFKKWPGATNSDGNNQSPRSSDIESEIERQVLELRKGEGFRCPQCGVPLKKDDLFCFQCGVHLRKKE